VRVIVTMRMSPGCLDRMALVIAVPVLAVVAVLVLVLVVAPRPLSVTIR
jgi:hypothetical protein